MGEVEGQAADSTAVKKKPFDIDFAELFGEDHDEPVKDIVVVSTNRRRRPPLVKERELVTDSMHDGDGDEPPRSGDDYSSISDSELKVRIDRLMKTFPTMSVKLKDGGEKLKARLQGMQDELQRRLRRCDMGSNGYEKPMHPKSSGINGLFDGSKQAAPSSQSPTVSSFATSFLKKMEDDNPKQDLNTRNQASNAFDSELSYLNPSDKSKRSSSGKLPQSKRAKAGLCSKGFVAWNYKDRRHLNGGKHMQLNGKHAGKISLFCTYTDDEGSQASNANGLKNEKTVVLVDEEGPELLKKNQEDKDLPSMSAEGKIYYPSREDPESLEIFRSELKCLEPGECLTSTIMNFYIRYLQELYSPANSSEHNFYFFNTYFYSKLQEAVAYQQKSDKEAVFMKFRRWWKGVNIFQKAYIFLPINEDNHWSLAIICIPGEEGETGLVILHLDSLGLHSSSSIFHYIKSMLINEWKILKKDNEAVNALIPDRIWQHLPRRIEQKYIVVPRQTNDYDCGLFVLYYVERFIQEAPARLTRQLSSMFGKHWFKPQEASNLRGRIKSILLKEFQEALKQDSWTWEPVCSSVNAETIEAIDLAEIS